MSDGNIDPHDTLEQQQGRQPGRVPGARSASPAKRSAADMEGSGHSASSDAMDTQESVRESVETPGQDSMVTDPLATSFESDKPPPYSANDGPTTPSHANSIPSIDEQVAIVMRLVNEHELDEGTAGYAISWKWLGRVVSRCTERINDSTFPKEAREGDIGLVDNSDIVPEGAFLEPILKGPGDKLFIPLKPGRVFGEDYQMLPEEAYGMIVGWYGNTLGQKPIVRFMHNTAGEDASQQNMQYEMYPPVITVRKIPQTRPELEETSPSSRPSFEANRLEAERRARGQLSPDDAVQFVSSRSERFNDFLKRSKDAAGVARDCQVRIWRLLDATQRPVDEANHQTSGVLSPPHSRSASPKAARAPRTKLVLDSETFNKMELGKDVEHIEAKDMTHDSKYNGKSTMQTHALFEDMTIALEEWIGGPGGGEFASESKKVGGKLSHTKRVLGSKPGSAAPSGRTSPAPSGGMMTRGRQRRDGRTRGTVGLGNLGNTCYMNSALQCIRSVEELAIYFLSNKFKSEINNNNPLGHHGNMARRYAELLQNIYADNTTGAITPNAFRKTLGNAQPMFSGYGQQDSQEFLSFLVDALHEDLNRIDKKPYNENPDSDDKTVHDPEAIIKLGETYRSNHKARNDSVAMDLFSGFYKNTMECPVCDKISITFDPYSLLTVQLPIENAFQHTITFVPLRGKPVNHAVDMDKNSTIKMLKEYIASRHKGVQAERLWMVEVYSHRIYKVFDNRTTLAEANPQPNDYLFVYELEAVPTNVTSAADRKAMNSSFTMASRSETIPDMDDPKAEEMVVPIFSRQKSRNGYSWESILHPMFIVVTREEAQNYDVVLKKVLIAVSRLTSRTVLTEMDADQRGDESASNVEMRDQSAAEDNAQVSENSISSEDGYVEVSIDKDPPSHRRTDATMARENEQDDRPVPKSFMDPNYFLSPDLRSNLFTMNSGHSENGTLHCTGMACIKDSSIRVMYDRVKESVRRASVQSSTSSEESTTSAGSGAQANGVESDESDADDLDRQTTRIGGESPLRYPNGSEDELPDDPLQLMSRKGRRKKVKHSKRRGALKTYSKKDQRGGHRKNGSTASYGSNNSSRGYDSKFFTRKDDNTFYIKLGEGIVLDWYPEAVKALFGGDENDADDERGHFVSSPDGKNLPFADDPTVDNRKRTRESRKKHGVTLDDCFAETGKREVLSEDNAWYCNRCKELRRATKTLEIWTIPDILVVHLKRFGGNRSFRDKIDVLVDYPIEGLNMTERIGLTEEGKEYVYDLFAVDNHFGGLGGGHYTAMAKNFYDGQWYDYNDSICTKVSNENRLHSAAAYLLFYRRRSETPLGPQYLQDLVEETRNPAPIENAGDVAEESDSGEGKLGGQNGFFRGSPSVLNGAGVDPANPRSAGNGSIGAGTQAANRSLTTKMTSTQNSHGIGMIAGKPVYGPQRPLQSIGFENRGGDWGFTTLDDHTQDAAGSLMSQVEDTQDNDDAASTTALMDASDDQDRSNLSSLARPTPNGSDEDLSQRDDHGLYSSRGRYFNEGLHLEDAGRMGEEDMEDLPTLEVNLEGPSPFAEDEEYDKMD